MMLYSTITPSDRRKIENRRKIEEWIGGAQYGSSILFLEE